MNGLGVSLESVHLSLITSHFRYGSHNHQLSWLILSPAIVKIGHLASTCVLSRSGSEGHRLRATLHGCSSAELPARCASIPSSPKGHRG